MAAKTYTYYLNSVDLDSATAIYMDAALTQVSVDGYYQADSVVRQLLNGVLQPAASCANCGYLCGVPITHLGYDEGIFKISIDLGTGTGAVILKFDAFTNPIGVVAEFNSVAYNKVSSPVYGYLAAPSGLANYIGDYYLDCGLVADSPYTLQVYRYNGTNFDLVTGDTDLITIGASQLNLTIADPGNCVMVIPKTVISPSVVNISVICACPSPEFGVEVYCPAALTSFDSSIRYADEAGACGMVVGMTTYYVANVNGTPGGDLGLYDWVFSDVNGQNILPDGFYFCSTVLPNPYNWYRVANGIIVEFGTC